MVGSTFQEVSKKGLTAGEDQLPQESANVTKGSDHSKPKILRILSSSFFADFERVCKEIINLVSQQCFGENFSVDTCVRLQLVEPLT